MGNVATWLKTAAGNNTGAAPDYPVEGMAPSTVNDTMRESMAALARWYGDTNGSLTTGGTGTAYTLTTNSAHATLAAQSLIVAEINTDSTGAATLNVDSLGAKSIIMPDGGAIAAGTLKAGTIAVFAYEAGADSYVLIAGSNLGTAAALDSGTASGNVLVAGDNGLAAASGGIPIGTPIPTFSSTPDTNHLMLNGDSIGSTSSGADHAGDDFEALYLKYWAAISDTYAAVAGGRGASAAADWAANKAMTLPNAEDAVLVGAGSSYVAGETGGAATVTLTEAELPAHNHDVTAVRRWGSDGPTTPIGWSASNGSSTNGTISSANAGSGDAHENMPPFIAVYWQVRYQ